MESKMKTPSQIVDTKVYTNESALFMEIPKTLYLSPVCLHLRIFPPPPLVTVYIHVDCIKMKGNMNRH